MCKFCDHLRELKKDAVKSRSYHVKIVESNDFAITTHGKSHKLNYCPECGKRLSHLRECPFCEKEVAKTIPDRQLHLDAPGNGFYTVCNVREGGCGASSGWHKTEEESIEAWNRRVGE